MIWMIFAAQLASAEPSATVELRGAAPSGWFSAPTLDDAMLGKTTARGDQTATSTLTATSSNNSVSGTVTTGSVGFADSSFQNPSGLLMVNANSGNNVAINSAMTINISITPGP